MAVTRYRVTRQKSLEFALWMASKKELPGPNAVAAFLGVHLMSARDWRNTYLQARTPKLNENSNE